MKRPSRTPSLRWSLPRPIGSVERLLAALLALLISLLVKHAHAATGVVIEIDGSAERVVDARSARRLIPLELADVAVPTLAPARGADLFFRVLGRESGNLRVELWERGEFHGARSLSGSGESPQLVARRVALAAAELGRRLARKRETALLREARGRLVRAARDRAQRERTQEGPVALRSELVLGGVPDRLWLFGQRLSGELTLRGPLRLDVGADAWTGRLQPRLRTALYGVTLGPAYRVRLGRTVDCDLGLRVAMEILQAPSASSLDAVPGQLGTWTAIAAGATRLELRLTRQVRLAGGLELGGLLRSVSYESDAGTSRLHGLWLASSLGIIVTPAR